MTNMTFSAITLDSVTTSPQNPQFQPKYATQSMLRTVRLPQHHLNLYHMHICDDSGIFAYSSGCHARSRFPRLLFCSHILIYILYESHIGRIGDPFPTERISLQVTTIWTIISKSSSSWSARARFVLLLCNVIACCLDVYLSDYENTCVLRRKRMELRCYRSIYVEMIVCCVALCLHNAIWCRDGGAKYASKYHINREFIWITVDSIV